MKKFDEPAVLIHSGGQDSTTCLVWALKYFKGLKVLTFNYNQRHGIEIECAKEIISRVNAAESNPLEWYEPQNPIEHEIIDISFLSRMLSTAMIQDVDIVDEEEGSGLPNTFVPGRNLLFLTIAAAYAYQHGIKHLVTGVCQTDFSGYPDCRDATIKSLQATLNLGMEYDIIIHTPLMWLSKADTVRMMDDLGGLELYKYTHTCYKGERPACGECPACKLRWKGFVEAAIDDPLEYKKVPEIDS